MYLRIDCRSHPHKHLSPFAWSQMFNTVVFIPYLVWAPTNLLGQQGDMMFNWGRADCQMDRNNSQEQRLFGFLDNINTLLPLWKNPPQVYRALWVSLIPRNKSGWGSAVLLLVWALAREGVLPADNCYAMQTAHLPAVICGCQEKPGINQEKPVERSAEQWAERNISRYSKHTLASA